METYKREFIAFLEKAGVLKFGDFIAKSGRRIPYFINAGDIKTGAQIARLGEFYATAYLDKIGEKKAVLYGPAYKGIPIAVSASVALAGRGLDLPFFFNRKEAKDHGEGGIFVGYVPKAGESVVIVEDVITVTRELCPEIVKIEQAMKSFGAEGTLMSGSGPSVFGLFTDSARATAAFMHFRVAGYRQAFLTEFTE